MSFRNNAYAKVWEIKQIEGQRSVSVRLSTSTKDKMSGEYVQDFSGYVRFVSSAADFARKLNSGDTVLLKEIAVTTRYDKERKKEYVNYLCFECDYPENRNGNTSQKHEQVEENPVEGAESNDLPF